MTMEQLFQKTKWFKIDENWGDITKVSPVLIMALDRFRDTLGCPVYISPIEGAVYAPGTGHSGKSWHYIIEGRNQFSMAADIFPEGDILTAWTLALKMVDFGGVGLYPFNCLKLGQGKELIGMLHLDIRQPYTLKELWWRDVTNQYHYIKSARDIISAIETTRNFE